MKKGEIKKRVHQFVGSQSFRNSIWNLINTVTYPVFVLATTPFFISRLGPEQYGIWVLINTTTQLMSIFNLGLGDTAIKYISKFRALKQDDEIRQTMSVIWGIGFLVFGLAVLLGFSLYLMISKTTAFNIGHSLRGLAAASALIAFILFGLKFLEQIVFSALQGYERYDIAAKLSLASRLSILSGNFFLIYFNYSLLEVFISSALILFTFLFIEIIIVRRKFPVVRFLPHYHRATVRNIFSFGFWSWTQSLLAIITTQTDKLIVAYFSGVQTLSYYSLGSLLTTQIHGVFSSISAWVFPSASKKSSEGKPLIFFYRKVELMLAGFGFACLITFLIIQKPLLTYWLGSDTYSKSIGFIKIFVYYNLFLLLNIMPYYFLNGAGFVRLNTVGELITKILNIIGMVLCYLILGTKGLIWGLVFSMLLATPIRISVLYAYAFKNKNIWTGIEAIFCPTLIVLIFEMDALVLKLIFSTLFILSFYFFYVRKLATAKVNDQKHGEA